MQLLKSRDIEARIVRQMTHRNVNTSEDSMQVKERNTSAMSFTSAVPLSDEDVRKNIKLG